MKSWAEKAIAKYERKDDWGIECVSSTEVQYLLLKEHARSVRIVKAYLAKYGTEGSPCELICNDLLAALTKGRGKGRVK